MTLSRDGYSYVRLDTLGSVAVTSLPGNADAEIQPPSTGKPEPSCIYSIGDFFLLYRLLQLFSSHTNWQAKISESDCSGYFVSCTSPR